MCLELLLDDTEYKIVKRTGSHEELEEYMKDFSKNESKHIQFTGIEKEFTSIEVMNKYYNGAYVPKIYNNILKKSYDMLIIYNSPDGKQIQPSDIYKYIDEFVNISLIVIDYHHSLSNLPPNINSLYITADLHSSDPVYKHSLDNLPIHLETLIISVEHYGIMSGLPSELLTLEFNSKCTSYITNLPNNLYYLGIGGRFNAPLYDLPRSLKVLDLSDFYQIKLTNLPDLKKLYVGSDYYHPLEDLPKSLEELTIYGDPEYIVLPKNLKTISFGFESYRLNCSNNLPDSLEYIYVCPCGVDGLFALLEDYIPYNLKEININKTVGDYVPNTKDLEFIDRLAQIDITVKY